MRKINYERESMIMIIFKSGKSSVKISELLGDKVGIMIIFSPGILKVKIPEWFVWEKLSCGGALFCGAYCGKFGEDKLVFLVALAGPFTK